MILNKEKFEEFKLTQSKTVKKAKSKNISTAFIYKIPTLPLNSISGELELLSTDKLKQLEEKEYYGLNFLHLFAFNKDPKVLTFILNLFQQHNLPFTKLHSKAIKSQKFNLQSNDTPMNIALRQCDLEKIQTLIEHNYSEITTKQESTLNTFRYRHETHNLLELCCTLAQNNNKIDFFVGFALSQNSYENYDLDFENNDFKYASYSNLLLYPPIFKNKKFQEDIIHILEKLSSTNQYYPRFFCKKEKFEVLDNIINYTPHVINSVKFVDFCKKFLLHYGVQHPNAVEKYKEKINVIYENQLLNNQLKNSKKTQTIKL